MRNGNTKPNRALSLFSCKASGAHANPRHKMNKNYSVNGHSRSERERLDWLVGELTSRMGQNLSVSQEGAEELEPLIVCTSLVRLAFSHARAVSFLLREGLVESIAPLERTIYEIWVEFRYFVREGNKIENARRLMINAGLEFSEYAIKARRTLSAEAVRACLRSLRSYKLDFPEIYEAVRLQRKRRKYHWSGLSRSELVKKVATDITFYKGLSWEVHAVLSPIRDLSMPTEDDDDVINFQPVNDLEEQAELQAWTVGGMLYNLWNEYAYCFGFELVLLDDDEGDSQSSSNL